MLLTKFRHVEAKEVINAAKKRFRESLGQFRLSNTSWAHKQKARGALWVTQSRAERENFLQETGSIGRTGLYSATTYTHDKSNGVVLSLNALAY